MITVQWMEFFGVILQHVLERKFIFGNEDYGEKEVHSFS